MRILSVESGCGCTDARAEPKLVPPGEPCRILLTASPVQFGLKPVAIRVRTDSPETPLIELQLQIIGSRKPPFLQSAAGGVIFSDPTAAQTESLTVSGVVPSETEDVPLVSCELPYVRVEPIGNESRPEGTVPGIDFRVYRYRVTLDGNVPGNFRGEIRVFDPWVEGRFLPVSIAGTMAPPIRVTPTRPTIRAGASAASGQAATFVVVARDRELVPRISVAMEDGAAPLVIERGETQGGGFWVPFRVRPPEEGTLKPGEYSARVTAGPDSEAVRVSIRVRGDEP